MLYAVVVAAGQGRRMGFKKQFLQLADRPMWLRSVEAMFEGGAEHTVVVCSEEDLPALKEVLHHSPYVSRCTLVIGGTTRHESVRSGMHYIHSVVQGQSLDEQDVLVAVHDAARPFVAADDIASVFDQARKTGAAILGRYCRDTVKWVHEGLVDRTVPREHLFLAETPQVIRGDFIERAYLDSTVPDSPTDDAALLESLSLPVTCVEARGYNGKVTTPADLDYAEWLAQKRWGEEERHEDRVRI